MFILKPYSLISRKCCIFFTIYIFQAPESINVPDSKAADHGKVIHLKWIAFPCSAQARSGEGESEARQLVIPNN